MEVYKPGTKVKLIDDIIGNIRAINIDSSHGIQYEIIWWSNRERKTSWLEPFEIKEFDTKEQLQIGFK